MKNQLSFFGVPYNHRFASGGKLRRERAGRKARPLSTKDQIHLILKSDLKALPKGLRHPRTQTIIKGVVRQYQKRFFIRVAQVSIQRDHIHLMIKTTKRSNYLSFFKVLAGQIAQRVTDTFNHTYSGARVWKERPFTRVTRSYQDRLNLKDYIKLNELEALGKIPYQTERLSKLTPQQRQKIRAWPLEEWWYI